MLAESSQIIVLPTSGSCMRPWIWPSGHIHVLRCGIGELNLGDIAVWFDGRKLISHRVVEISQDSFVTMSDWAIEPDARTQATQLLGRGVRFSRGRVSYRLDGIAATAVTSALLAARAPTRWVVRAYRRFRSLMQPPAR